MYVYFRAIVRALCAFVVLYCTNILSTVVDNYFEQINDDDDDDDAIRFHGRQNLLSVKTIRHWCEPHSYRRFQLTKPSSVWPITME